MSSLDVLSVILSVFGGRKVPSPCHYFLEVDGLQQTLRIFGHNYRPGLILGGDLTSLECIRNHVHLSQKYGATGSEDRYSADAWSQKMPKRHSFSHYFFRVMFVTSKLPTGFLAVSERIA